METAKVFENGRSQAMHLSKRFHFDVDEVVIRQIGAGVSSTPENTVWREFIEGIESFTDDIFEGGREQGVQEERTWRKE